MYVIMKLLSLATLLYGVEPWGVEGVLRALLPCGVAVLGRCAFETFNESFMVLYRIGIKTYCTGTIIFRGVF